MSAKCKICKNNLHIGPDSLVLCAHKKGFIHRGCCVAHCSKHGEPCGHAKAEYSKMDPQFNGEMFAFFG
ncbi:hypothetical protein GQ473_06835 [archaeon]|nr:hypothetical protein [archaeon]